MCLVLIKYKLNLTLNCAYTTHSINVWKGHKSWQFIGFLYDGDNMTTTTTFFFQVQNDVNRNVVVVGQ